MEGKRFIHKIKLQNFLSYGSEGEEIELQPLNVLIGTNTSGTSNLIEAIGILKAIPTDLPAPFRQGGGISEFLWKGNKDTPIAEIKITIDYPQKSHSILLDYTHPESVVVCERDNTATRHSKHGKYDKKTRRPPHHALEILKRLNADIVRQTSPYCDRLFNTLISRIRYLADES